MQTRSWYRLMLCYALLVTALIGGCKTAPPPVAETPKVEPTYQGLGADSVTPAILTEFAPKPLASAQGKKVQTYLDIRSPSAGVMSPDGKQLYFNWKVTGTMQIWKVEGPDHFPIQMTGGEDSTLIEDISPDGKWLILSRDQNGEENPGLYLLSTSGGSLREIHRENKVQTHYAGLSDDGRTLYFTANNISPSSRAIYAYDLVTQQNKLLFSDPGNWDVIDISKGGEFLLSKEFSNIKNEVYVLKPGQPKQILFGQNEESFYEAVFGKSSDEFFVSTPRKSNFKNLYRFKAGVWTQIDSIANSDIERIMIDRSRQTLYYGSNEGGYYKVHARDAETLNVVNLPVPTGTDQARVQNISRDGRWVTLVLDSSQGPPHPLIYDRKLKSSKRWTLPSTPEINTAAFAKNSPESYPAEDGTPIPMWVRRPSNCPAGSESQCPVVVHFHGGPEGQSLPGFSVPAQLFVDAGFIFVEPNVRGSAGYGQAWLNSDNGPKRLNVISDIAMAAKFIREQWKCQKVGVYGGSYGGYSVLYAMSRYAGAYDAGVEIVGMSNLISFLNNTAPYRREQRIAEYGDPVKDAEALTKLSPIHYLDQIVAPLLMIQGVNDPRVPVGEALQINAALKKRNVPHELILFPDEGHGAAKRGNQAIQLSKSIEFFVKHLK